MRRRGYLSALGASGSLAIAGVLALLLVSAAIAFNGWPGLEESPLHEREVRLAAPRAAEDVVKLPRARRAHDQDSRGTRPRASVRRRDRQAVKGRAHEGSARKAPATATPAASPTSEGTVSPVGPSVDGSLDEVQEELRRTVPPASELADPVIDQVQEVTGGGVEAIDQLLPRD